MSIDVLDVVHCVTQMTTTEYKRNARFNLLVEYDHLAKPDDFIETTEWYNGEGFDVYLSTSAGEQRMSFSWGEYAALKATLGNWTDDQEGVTSR